MGSAQNAKAPPVQATTPRNRSFPSAPEIMVATSRGYTTRSVRCHPHQAGNPVEVLQRVKLDHDPPASLPLPFPDGHFGLHRLLEAALQVADVGPDRGFCLRLPIVLLLLRRRTSSPPYCVGALRSRARMSGTGSPATARRTAAAAIGTSSFPSSPTPRARASPLSRISTRVKPTSAA